MRKKKVAVIWWTVAILFLLLFLVSFIFQEPISSLIEGELGRSSLLILFVITFILEILPQYLAPHLFAIQAKLLGLSIFETFSSMILGSLAGSLLGFWLGERYGLKFSRKVVGEKDFDLVEEKVNGNGGKWVVALAAFSPIPYLALVFGAIGFSRRSFFFYGLIPRFFSYVVAIGFIFYFL